MSMPIPPGTSTGRPSLKTSRCAWTWYSSVSLRSGSRPASRAIPIGSSGSGQSSIGSIAGEGEAVGVSSDEHANVTASRVHATAATRRIYVGSKWFDWRNASVM
jgi:hypothetical protein